MKPETSSANELNKRKAQKSCHDRKFVFVLVHQVVYFVEIPNK